MNRLGLLAGFLCGLLVAWAVSCGGGDVPSSLHSPAFDEQWEPRTAATGVYGSVWSPPLASTPDGSDPQTGWSSHTITGKWGSLGGEQGLGPNRFWHVDGGRLYFDGGGANSFALVSGMTFSRSAPIVLETDFIITAGNGAFVGLCLCSGEGDYREVALRRTAGVDYVNRATPLRETQLATALPGKNTLRIEYDPITGFRYIANGVEVGTEALDHEGASFATDPSVGLYFASSEIPGAFVQGSVGPVRVWTGP